MMTFGDRTAEFASVAQALRNKGLVPKTKRKETIYTSRKQINQLASEIGKDTHATAQKLAVLTKRTSTKGVEYENTSLQKTVSTGLQSPLQRLSPPFISVNYPFPLYCICLFLALSNLAV